MSSQINGATAACDCTVPARCCCRCFSFCCALRTTYFWALFSCSSLLQLLLLWTASACSSPVSLELHVCCQCLCLVLHVCCHCLCLVMQEAHFFYCSASVLLAKAREPKACSSRVPLLSICSGALLMPSSFCCTVDLRPGIVLSNT